MQNGMESRVFTPQRIPDAVNVLIAEYQVQMLWDEDKRNVMIVISLTALPFIKITLPMQSLAFIQFVHQMNGLLERINSGESQAETDSLPPAA